MTREVLIYFHIIQSYTSFLNYYLLKEDRFSAFLKVKKGTKFTAYPGTTECTVQSNKKITLQVPRFADL